MYANDETMMIGLTGMQLPRHAANDDDIDDDVVTSTPVPHSTDVSVKMTVADNRRCMRYVQHTTSSSSSKFKAA